MDRTKKSKGTFIVKVVDAENATWQGTVTWAEKNVVQNFRSALELVKMLDTAISGSSEEEPV